MQYFHVFTYSDRDGTPASRMPGKVDHAVKKERSRIMIEMGKRKRYAFSERYVGRTVDVLFETEAKGYWTGFTSNYMRVQAKCGEPLRNQIRPVRPISIEGDTLVGELA